MYVVDLYNKYQRNRNVVYVSKVNDLELCIRKLDDNYEWGEPIVDFPEKNLEDNFYVYDTLEEAKKYVRMLRFNDGRIS